MTAALVAASAVPAAAADRAPATTRAGAAAALAPRTGPGHGPEDGPGAGHGPARPGHGRGSDRTTPAEARRVDRVPTPTPSWTDCAEALAPGAECALVELPLDYDHPRGPTTSVAVMRVPASDPEQRIGSLFINPGGPGGSGVEAAAGAAMGLPDEVRAKFDIVGFDPRGTNNSDHVECYADADEQAVVEAPVNTGEVFGPESEAALVGASRALGTACSTRGKQLASAMSTAEVARDMDVLRRMLGDQTLTYLGFSYGSYLGVVYANLFPDRVRAVVIDGVDDPQAWSGTIGHDSGRRTVQEASLLTGDADQRAVTETLKRCAEAGPERCRLANLGDPAQIYADLLAQLEAEPIVVSDATGEQTVNVTRSAFQGLLLSMLYEPNAPELVDGLVALAWTLAQPPAPEGSEEAAAQAAARETVLTWAANAVIGQEEYQAVLQERRGLFGQEAARPNDFEATTAVTCTDGLHPRDAARWPAYAAATDATSGGFGRYWTWTTGPCATKTWRAADEDTYLGPFTRRTAAPVLIIGNYWDPATRYEGAVAASRLLPNSRLLSSDSWGHTATGTSTCVDDALEAYLVSGTLPAAGTVCTGDVQPFTTPLAGDVDEATQEALDETLTDPAEPGPIVEPPTTPEDVLVEATEAAAAA